MGQVETWNALANQLSVDSIRSTTAAGSGHPTSSLSAAHLMAVLFATHIRYDFDDPGSLGNDRFVLSKGHAAPVLYAVLRACGVVSDYELMSLRKFGSSLEGHPVPKLPWVDAATGSLGQGLAVGVGMALIAQREKLPSRIWVLMGDSEMSEGSVWEAVATAAFYGLSNLIGILDMNRLGQRGPTQLEWNSSAYAERVSAFGWRAIEIDGHDVVAIDAAYTEAENSDRPTMIIAKTVKGHGVPEVADKDGWHGKPLPSEIAEPAIESLGGVTDLKIEVAPPDPAAPVAEPASGLPTGYRRPTYREPVATRQAYGDTLKALGAVRRDIVVLDGEVGNSTFAEIFGHEYPDRFFEMYIAEQLMVGAAVGMAALHKSVFASSFAAFLTRAYDFIRMASVSGAPIKLCGSHAGVSIGQDGPSQMGLEDLAMMRAVHGSTVLSPADGPSTVRLVEQMADLEGVSYIRTMRGATPLLYGPDEDFPVGGSKRLRDGEDVTIVGTGIGVHSALEAAELLGDMAVGVIDCYSVKPLDVAGLPTYGRVYTVEDHHPEGGLGEAVAAALSGTDAHVTVIGVENMPGSGTPGELQDQAGISGVRVAERIRRDLSVR